MMSSTFGAPFGGTMRGAHQAFDCRALSLITPPNFGGGAGSCLPSIVVVALGEPGVPLTCCAKAGDVASMSSAQAETVSMPALIIVIPRVRTHGASTSSNAQNGFARLSFRATSRCRDSMRPEVNAQPQDRHHRNESRS